MREEFQLAVASEVLSSADVWSMASSTWVAAALPSASESLCGPPSTAKYLRVCCSALNLHFRLLAWCADSPMMFVKSSRKRSRLQRAHDVALRAAC